MTFAEMLVWAQEKFPNVEAFEDIDGRICLNLDVAWFGDEGQLVPFDRGEEK